MGHRTCSVEGCGRRHKGHGYCQPCLTRFRKFGSPERLYRPTLTERFWAKVDKKSEDECWPWAGSRLPKGYGKIGAGSRDLSPLSAHRVSYEIAYGPIPNGMQVLHRCDFPPCVNPLHLQAGTSADNMADKKAKGRAPSIRNCGEKAGSSKLKTAQVVDIRGRLAAKEPRKEIAKAFGVSISCISHIASGRHWRHVA